MTIKVNPYEAPRQPSLDLTRRGITLVPRRLAMHTRKVVNRFGLFQLAWPIVVAYWTGSLQLDIWALFIASNGRAVTRASFKRFPWTAVMCGVYPITLVVSATTHDLLSIWTWIPSQSSPVLLMQLVSAAWASYAIHCILRCYFAHQATPIDGPPWGDPEH